jgi:hypothetical protein
MPHTSASLRGRPSVPDRGRFGAVRGTDSDR